MKHLKSDFLIIRKPDDNTYDIFFKMKNGKLDFVSNHETYEEAVESLNKPVTDEYFNNWANNLRKKLKESFEEFYNNKQS